MRLSIKQMPVKDLVPYANNARIHSAEQVDTIKASIEEFGFNDPVGVWTNPEGRLEIVEGHGRVMAAEQLGLEKVPTINLDHLTDEQRRAYSIVHNQTTDNSAWDFSILGGEIEELDYDWGSFGIGEELLGGSSDRAEVVEVDVPESAPERVKLGDIWQLGNHRLICGDSTDAKVIGRLMEGGVADAAVTDPPYNVNYSQSAGYKNNAGCSFNARKILNDCLPQSDFVQFLRDSFKNMADSLKEGGAFYVWHASSTMLEFEQALRMNNLVPRQQLIWVKNAFVLGRQDYQWKHEPCLYGWKEGAAHYFRDTRNETTVFDDQIELKKLKKAEMLKLLEEVYSGKISTTPSRTAHNQQHRQRGVGSRPLRRKRLDVNRLRADKQEMLHGRAGPAILRRNNRAMGRVYRLQGREG